MISSASRSTPAASRAPQRLGDLGLGDPEQPQHLLADLGVAADRAPERVGLDRRAPTSAAARAAGPAARRPIGPVRPSAGGTTRPGAVPDRLEDRRPERDRRLLAVRPPRSPRGRVRASASRSPRGSRRCVLAAPRRATVSRPWKRPTTSAVRSSAVGPRPPLVTIRSTPSRASHAQRGLHVVRPVADDDDRLEVDPELAQALGQPRPVAVGDAAREHLGAGDDDARARAHVQLGRCEPVSRGERRRPDRVADPGLRGRHGAARAVDEQPHLVVAERQPERRRPEGPASRAGLRGSRRRAARRPAASRRQT